MGAIVAGIAICWATSRRCDSASQFGKLMDKSIVEKITGAGLAFLGCHRGPDGQCNYLCRLVGQGDYGERFDHDFYAYSKDRNGDLKLTGHFALSITRSAIDTYWIQQIIHDSETFM